MSAATSDGEPVGLGTTDGGGVAAAIRDEDGATGVGVSVMPGAVLTAAGGDSVGEGAALP